MGIWAFFILSLDQERIHLVVKIVIRGVTSGVRDAMGPEGCPQVCKGPHHNFSFVCLNYSGAFTSGYHQFPKNEAGGCCETEEISKTWLQDWVFINSKWLHIKNPSHWQFLGLQQMQKHYLFSILSWSGWAEEEAVAFTHFGNGNEISPRLKQAGQSCGCCLWCSLGNHKSIIPKTRSCLNSHYPSALEVWSFSEVAAHSAFEKIRTALVGSVSNAM